MNIRSLLEAGHNKLTTESIISYVEKNPDKFTVLMECFFDKNIRICQRASWPAAYLGNKFPELLTPYFFDMIKNLENPKHNVIVRNTLRSWQNMDIPEEFQGDIFEKCFTYFNDPKAAIAIRALSISICAKLAENFPELKDELSIAIRDHLDLASPGISSRCLRILKSLCQ